MNQENDHYTINQKKEVYYEPLSDKISVVDLLAIDPSTMVSEALNFPAMLHAIGLEKIEAQNNERIIEARLKTHETTYESDRSDYYRGVKKEKGLTEAAIKLLIAKDVLNNDILDALRDDLISAKRNKELADNLYWCAKAKVEQLKRVQI